MIAAFGAGRRGRARHLNARLLESFDFESTEEFPNPLPAKAACRALGLAGRASAALPMGPAPPELDGEARRVLRAWARRLAEAASRCQRQGPDRSPGGAGSRVTGGRRRGPGLKSASDPPRGRSDRPAPRTQPRSASSSSAGSARSAATAPASRSTGASSSSTAGSCSPTPTCPASTSCCRTSPTSRRTPTASTASCSPTATRTTPAASPSCCGTCRVPIYGSELTLGLARNRIDEAGPRGPGRASSRSPTASAARIGPCDVEFIPVTHSVPNAFAIAFHTPQGVILHSGDFKLDLQPVDGRRTDLARIGALADGPGHPAAAVGLDQRRGAGLHPVGVARSGATLRRVFARPRRARG